MPLVEGSERGKNVFFLSPPPLLSVSGIVKRKKKKKKKREKKEAILRLSDCGSVLARIFLPVLLPLPLPRHGGAFFFFFSGAPASRACADECPSDCALPETHARQQGEGQRETDAETVPIHTVTLLLHLHHLRVVRTRPPPIADRHRVDLPSAIAIPSHPIPRSLRRFETPSPGRGRGCIIVFPIAFSPPSVRRSWRVIRMSFLRKLTFVLSVRRWCAD